MIRHAERLFPDEPRVTWQVADAMTFRGGAPYDLIISNCALHWLHPFRDGMRNILGQLSPDGRFAAAIMLDGTLSELRAARLRAAPLKPPAGRLPTFDEVLDLLREEGLAISYASEDRRSVHLPSAEAVLRMVHDQGFTGGHISRAHLPLTRRELAEVVRDYNFTHRDAEGAVPATFNVGLVVARRCAPAS
jgi:trans-aconitate methyltransferase